MAAAVVVDYDQQIGNPDVPECLLSFTRDQDFFRATERALPWRVPADGDANRMTLPILFVESLVRKAHVADPDDLINTRFLSTCMHVNFLRAALSGLMAAGLAAREDGANGVRVFDDLEQLQDKSDGLVKHASRDPNSPFRVDHTSFDASDPAAPPHNFAWLEALSLQSLTRRTQTLEAYVDLGKLVGYRAVEAARNDPDGQLFVMAAPPGGGQLLATVRNYYMGTAHAAAAVAPAFLSLRLGDFLEDTRWQFPYDLSYHDPIDYAFDLASRASWQKATKAEWPALILSKICRALGRLTVMKEVFEDVKGQPNELTREIQRLGDALLGGEPAQRMAFWRIVELDEKLKASYEGVIREAKAAGRTPTQMVNKILEIVQKTEAKDKDASDAAAEPAASSNGLAAPKREQMRRALGERSFASLEEKYLMKLQAPAPDFDRLAMLTDVFEARTVLPKAVLLACPGTRTAAYTAHSDFLGFLEDQRPKLAKYFGQCMAYDFALEGVPEELNLFEWDARQLDLFRSFQWERLDPLNHAVLKIKSELVGSTFTSHDASSLYRHGDLINHTKEIYGKLFQGLGYPKRIEAGTGVTYHEFMDKIRAMHEMTMGLDHERAEGMFRLIDQYVDEAMRAAATTAKCTIYGANPADRALGPWLESQESVLVKMKETMKSMQEVRRFRKYLPEVFGESAPARTLPGFEGKRKPDLRREEDEGKPNPKKDKPGKGKNKVKREGERSKEAEVEQEAKRQRYLALTDKDTRLKDNPKNVHYYDNGAFSIKRQMFDWPGICAKYGWDSDKLCGPVIMACTEEKNRHHNCVDPNHT